MAKGNPNPHQAALAAQERNTKHGAYKLQRLATSEWPIELQHDFRQRCEDIYGEPHIDRQAHRLAVEQCVKSLMIVDMCYGYIWDRGAIGDDNQLMPIFKILPLWVNSANRQLASLGLTPLAADRIKLLTDARSWEARALTGEVDVEDTN
jgi:hypothetical protein